MSQSPTPSEDEDALHQLFAILRERVFDVTTDLQIRLQGELDDFDRIPVQGRVSPFRVLVSSLLQASNIVLGALEPLKSDDDDPSARAEPTSEPDGDPDGQGDT